MKGRRSKKKKKKKLEEIPETGSHKDTTSQQASQTQHSFNVPFNGDTETKSGKQSTQENRKTRV